MLRQPRAEIRKPVGLEDRKVAAVGFPQDLPTNFSYTPGRDRTHTQSWGQGGKDEKQGLKNAPVVKKPEDKPFDLHSARRGYGLINPCVF